MQYYKFLENDIFVNTLRTYPLYQFYIYSGSIYFDNQPVVSGSNTSNVLSVPDDHLPDRDWETDIADMSKKY